MMRENEKLFVKYVSKLVPMFLSMKSEWEVWKGIEIVILTSELSTVKTEWRATYSTKLLDAIYLTTQNDFLEHLKYFKSLKMSSEILFFLTC